MKYQIGDRVFLSKDREGIIRYAGFVYFATGIWYGIELYFHMGKHNGTVNDVQYFKCEGNKGIFVKAEHIRRKLREREIEKRGPNQYAPLDSSNCVQPVLISQENIKRFHEFNWSLLPYNSDSLKAVTKIERVLPKEALKLASVGDALGWLAKHFNIVNGESFLHLLFGGFILDKNRSFASYGIDEDSYVLVVAREGTDNDEIKIDEQRKSDHLEKLKNMVLETSNTPDMITLENDELCYVMPCGHAITKNSLLEYTKHKLKDNEIVITCPYINEKNEMCKSVWEYPLIRSIIKVKESIRKIIELYYSYNLLKQQWNAQRCGYCRVIQIRNGVIPSNHAKCRVCQADQKFCWQCSKPMKPEICQNRDCVLNDSDSWNNLIQNSGTKKIGPVANVPKVRACPKCYQLIEHETACKHMNCRMCKANFCFVCLKLCLPSGWQCGSYSSACPIAPIQTDRRVIKDNGEKQICTKRAILNIPNQH